MSKLSRRDAIASILLSITSITLGRKLMNNSDSNIDNKMPTLFLGHGSPMNAIEDNDFTRALQILGQNLPRPRAILMISAHWETQGTWITGMEKPKTIHDFYGFPKALFDIQYPAPGLPKLANDLSREIAEPNISIDMEKWGLDHGTWSVLRHIFPNADIPILQLSIDRTKPMEYHFEMGKKLKYLRNQGVMIMGSGNIVHNLKAISWDVNAKPHDWAIEFDEWTKEKLESRDFNSLIHDPLKSSAGKLSIPTLEHYLPLLYVLGASDSKDTLRFNYEGIQNASASMRCFQLS